VRRVQAILLSALLGIALSGCSANDPSGVGAYSASSPAATSQPRPVDLTHGLGHFTARFYPALAAEAGPNENLFISPLSLSQGLGLAWLGGSGRTAEELRTVLGWQEHESAALTSQYNGFLIKTDDPQVELRVANALWLASTLPVRREYLTAAKAAYDAEPAQVDFRSAPEDAARRINGWVSDRTKGRIAQIVEASQFDAATAAVLTNAVYFKADWQTPFDKNAEGTFVTGDGTKKPVTLMERVAPMQFRETSEGQAVALPYGNGRYVMEVFLPRSAATLRRWEQNLQGLTFFDGEQGSDGRFDLSAAKVQTILLRLPRFEARLNSSANRALIAAGMPCAFNKGCASFDRIAPLPMKIDDVAHATFLRVDDEGTEAAAATAVRIVVVGGRVVPDDIPRMLVDRPFLVTIRDRASGALIFFGRIADPVAVTPMVEP